MYKIKIYPHEYAGENLVKLITSHTPILCNYKDHKYVSCHALLYFCLVFLLL